MGAEAQPPLAGYRIIELGGIGPAPFCGMVLADMGADVIRIDRTSAQAPKATIGLNRGRRSIMLDLKDPAAIEIVLDLVAGADAVIEGFRPGVAERLGLGPEDCMARNPRLAYGRMTGFGQSGPLAQRAGHDINYIALSGVLASIGRTGGTPVPPINLVGDFGGGGLLLAVGVVSAILGAARSGKGRVIDAAMIDGSALLMTQVFSRLSEGRWIEARGANELDGGAPFYDVYECSDGKFMAVGALEPQFYKALIETLGVGDDAVVAVQHERSAWPAMRELFAHRFAERTRDQWAEVFADIDACVSPVLELSEAPAHPHNRARGGFLRDPAGSAYPAPAPRFHGSDRDEHIPTPTLGQHTREVLSELGRSEQSIDDLIASGTVKAAVPSPV